MRTPERAAATARFVASTVLPLPPLGENTVITLPVSAVAVPFAALRIAKSSVSADCGSTTTSAAPTARPVSTIPFGSPCAARMNGASVSLAEPADLVRGLQARRGVEHVQGDVDGRRSAVDVTGTQHRERRVVLEHRRDAVRRGSAHEDPKVRRTSVTTHRRSPGSPRRSGRTPCSSAGRAPGTSAASRARPCCPSASPSAAARGTRCSSSSPSPSSGSGDRS